MGGKFRHDLLEKSLIGVLGMEEGQYIEDHPHPPPKKLIWHKSARNFSLPKDTGATEENFWGRYGSLVFVGFLDRHRFGKFLF